MRTSFKTTFATFILLFSFSFTKAQDGFENFIFASVEDANKLTKTYINPAMEGLIFSMNSGWYHTAKVHKKLGFDISIGISAALVPDEDEFYNILDLNLNSITPVDSPIGATVAGSEDIQPLVNVMFTENGQTFQSSFRLPGGIKESLPFNAVPTPVAQLNVGLPLKFEASLRLVPKVGSDDVKGSMLGFGLKKEITDWFGPIGKLPLHVSILAAYSKMDVDYTIGNERRLGFSVTNGLAELDINAFTVQAIGSLNFPIVNVYGGIGYATGSSSLNLLGTYTANYVVGSRTLTDPIDIDFDTNGLRATLGARLSLGFFKLFADYTVQDYDALNLGVAFSFR